VAAIFSFPPNAGIHEQLRRRPFRSRGDRGALTGGFAVCILGALLAATYQPTIPCFWEESVPVDNHPVPKVLLIGIDGCRPDALVRALAPHMHRLILTGAFSDRAQTGDIPVSGPGWSSMLTGVWRQKHGVRDNDFDGADFVHYPHFFRRLKQARPDADTVSIVRWRSIHDHILKDAELAEVSWTDRQVADRAGYALRERKADAVFVQFEDVDQAGHEFGFDPAQPNYQAAIERTDSHVGRLLEAVRQRKTYAAEEWLILISTDHGGSGKSHGRDVPEDRTIFIVANGPSVTRGAIEPPPAIVDVAATALVHLGVPLDPSWQLDAKPIAWHQPVMAVRSSLAGRSDRSLAAGNR
jgi:predicted AlkP superfamily pyrophosphatase or phosphodiesterase